MVARLADRVGRKNLPAGMVLREAAAFGGWVARRLNQAEWEVGHLWSGIALETLQRPGRRGRVLLMRGSAHIRAQEALLQAEARRAGVRIERPGEGMVRREEEEYRLSDRICVLSSFARDTFLERGVDPAKLRLLPLGADTSVFRLSSEELEARRRRILAGAPLEVLFVGNLSLQKGMWDMAQIIRGCGPDRFRFRLVGARLPESRRCLGMVAGQWRWIPPQRGAALREQYVGADLFLFPTIQDGFGLVLAQARAAALPILATVHCAGPDLVESGRTGWTFPIRTPDRFIEQLHWCDRNREALAGMVEASAETNRQRDWAEVAADFEAICRAG